MKKILNDIAAERLRQVAEKGWNHAHDDAHSGDEMALAAACYAMPPEHRELSRRADPGGKMRITLTDVIAPRLWPWDVEWWRPKSRRQDLIRAAALIVAEIERLDRAAG